MDPSALLSLPLELHTVYYLGFDDILKARQVCRALESATRQRSLWMSILCNPPPPMDLYSYLVDKKLEMCTSSDLEAIVTDCLRRHTSWGHPSSVRVCEIDVTHWHRDPIVILPGGRWAIVFSDSGEAFAFDLHTASGDTYRQSPLFPGPWGPTSKMFMDLAAVVQTQEAGFQTELKMAVFSSYGDTIITARIQVWLLRPSYDGTNGHVVGLTAELLSSFCGPPKYSICHATISASFFGYLNIARRANGFEAHAVVVEWVKAHGQEDWEAIPKYVLPFGKHHRVGENSFFLIPNGTLVTSMDQRRSHELWHLHSMEPVFRIEDAVEAQPLGQGGGVKTLRPVSLPVFCPSDDRTRIATADLEFFKGTVISVDGIEDITLLPIPPLGRMLYCLGHLYGIDKCVDFEWYFNITTTKASCWSGPPHPCSITSFHNSMTLNTERWHIDSFSGLMIIGHREQ